MGWVSDIMSRREEGFIEEMEKKSAVKINVVGVGGCGNNIIDALAKERLPVKLIAMNTDAAVLRRTQCHARVLLGNPLTLARGAHGSPEVGAKAMESSIDEAIAAIDEDVDMVIGIAGMGGGTGTGGLPVLFRELSIKRPRTLKVAVITLPFREEGFERLENARYGLREVMNVADAIIVNANDLLATRLRNVSMPEAFRIMNRRIVRIVEALVKLNSPEVGPGLINVDFSNVQRIMERSGICFAGVGVGRSVLESFTKAIRDDFAEADVAGGRGALILFEGRETALDMGQIRSVVRTLSDDLKIGEVFMGLRPTLGMVDIRTSLFITGAKSRYVERLLGGGMP
ncbi:MAG: hypothetical protein DRN15_07420 [Thermoprotei archaeon]|nr:MAG: hypothetical protein DRN15_07420 [Thermoprotei archaeon]